MTLPNYRFNNRKFHRELQWTEMNTLGYQATEHEEIERKETNDKCKFCSLLNQIYTLFSVERDH